MQGVGERIVVEAASRSGHSGVLVAPLVVEARQSQLSDGGLQLLERSEQAGERRMGQRMLAQRADEEAKGDVRGGPARFQLAAETLKVEYVMAGRAQLNAGSSAQRLRATDGAQLLSHVDFVRQTRQAAGLVAHAATRTAARVLSDSPNNDSNNTVK